MQRRDFLVSTVGAAMAGSMALNLPHNGRAAEADAEIIDTHQHLWDLAKFKLPWLETAPDVLRKTYHLPAYREATQGLRVRSVYMEVHVDASQLVAEAEDVIGLCRAGTNPTLGAVIGARPESSEFETYLDRFRRTPEVKGVRRVLHAPETPAGFCLGETFVRSVRVLGERGLSFDLCMRPQELADGARLTELCPETPFIVDHCGNADPKAFSSRPTGDEPPAHTADEWRSGIDRLAKRRNVICKISGIIARLPKGGGAGELAPIVNHCLDAFGADRVVFGSDWPVCLLGASLRTWVEMLRQIVASRPEADQRKLWSENAIRRYHLKEA